MRVGRRGRSVERVGVGILPGTLCSTRVTDDRPTLDYATPGTDRRPRFETQWTRRSLLTAATFAMAGSAVLEHPPSDALFALLFLAIVLYSMTFWPAVLVLAVRDRWRPSSVLSGGSAAYLTFALAASFALLTAQWPPQSPLALFLFVTMLALAVDLAKARVLGAIASTTIVAATLGAVFPTSRCPHATQAYFVGEAWTLSGTPCGNEQHVGPWWWTLYRYP